MSSNKQQKIKLQSFSFNDCVGELYIVNNEHYQIKGTYTGSGSKKMYFWAASPPNYIQSFNGSGLPFPNPEIAYENTPNKQIINLDNPKTMNQFEIDFYYPNSYYHEQGRVYVPSHINFCFDKNGNKHKVFLNQDIPARSLSVSLFDPLV